MLATAPATGTSVILSEQDVLNLLRAAAGSEADIRADAARAIAAVVSNDVAQATAGAPHEPEPGFRARALARVDRALAQRARETCARNPGLTERFAIEAACLAAGAVAHARATSGVVDAVAVALAARDLG